MSPKLATSSDVEKALRERVKELTCLYLISQISSKPAPSLNDILKEVVDVLPTGWQFPEHAAAHIMLDDDEFSAHSDGPTHTSRQTAPLVVRGTVRGCVEVFYPRPPETGSATTFLPDEQRLLDEVARQVSLIIDRKETATEQERLHAKLRHADRLATIGQLAAGVAHELNEPLGSILGFAQLLAKMPDLPKQATNDIKKIEAASLHARETIRRLMTFARQTPPRDTQVDLNRLIRESADIWAPRCEAEEVLVEYELDDQIPDIVADDGQLRQVITNLAVNAVQAMPGGGKLRISTTRNGDWLRIVMADTGIGVPPDILPRLFDPFFTTKEVNEGTGLGLSVVQGIISGHGGKISVESGPNRGTQVLISLPIHRRPTQSKRKGGARGQR